MRGGRPSRRDFSGGQQEERSSADLLPTATLASLQKAPDQPKLPEEASRLEAAKAETPSEVPEPRGLFPRTTDLLLSWIQRPGNQTHKSTK